MYKLRLFKGLFSCCASILCSLLLDVLSNNTEGSERRFGFDLLFFKQLFLRTNIKGTLAAGKSPQMDSLSPTSDGPCWSMLPSDLLYMVFERLGFADFQRAKCVCSSWRFTSRQSVPKKQIPWMILFPGKGKDYCLLFNPEEKDRMYQIQDLGVNFTSSHCLAICGSWLFMEEPQYNLYIMNLFTRERINLPSVESQLGMIKIERTMDGMFLMKLTDQGVERYLEDIDIHLPIFWIDEKTKDYFVAWLIDYKVMAYAKNGDNVWKQAKLDNFCVDGLYRDHKLYLYHSYGDFTVLDFSGDIPRHMFETQINRDSNSAKGIIPRHPKLGDDVSDIKDTHFVVTVTGEFLRVKSIVRGDSDLWSFRIYKMDSSQSKWEELTSLGDEAILLDQHITVLANTSQGIKRNSIYFCGIQQTYRYLSRAWSERDIFNFSLDTHKVEHQSICSSIQLSDARWFVPN